MHRIRAAAPTAVLTPQTLVATRVLTPPITGYIADRLPPGLASRFELIEQVGAGGEARVYRAIRAADGREVAVKVFGPGITPRYLFPLDSPQHRRAFNSAHTVQVLERASEDGCHVEVMEYCSYGTLAGFVNSRGLQGRLLHEVIEQAARAIISMHPVVHGDIKPSNILIRRLEPLRLVLSDFGLSTDLGDRSRVTNVGLGSRVYMAPEASGSLRPSGDWWALGISIVELATGRHPMLGRDGGWPGAAELAAMLAAPIDLSGITDRRVRLLLRGLLVTDHRLRWGDAEVARWLAGGSPGVPTAPTAVLPVSAPPPVAPPAPKLAAAAPLPAQPALPVAPAIRRTLDPRRQARQAPLPTRIEQPAISWGGYGVDYDLQPHPRDLVPAPNPAWPARSRRRFSLSGLIAGLVGVSVRSILTVVGGSLAVWGVAVPGLSVLANQPLARAEYANWLASQLGVGQTTGLDPAIMMLIGSGLAGVFVLSLLTGAIRAIRRPALRVRFTLLGALAALASLLNLPALALGDWAWYLTNPGWQYWAFALPVLGRLIDALRGPRRPPSLP